MTTDISRDQPPPLDTAEELGRSDADLRALAADDFLVWLRAARALIARGDEAVAVLEASLPAQPPEVRKRVAYVLARVATPAAVRALAGLLQDPVQEVRAAAALEIDRAGLSLPGSEPALERPPAAARPPGLEAVVTPVEPVAQLLAQAMERARRDPAAPEVERLRLIEQLAVMRAPGAVEAVTAALHDVSGTVRAAAAQALREAVRRAAGDAQARERLAGALPALVSQAAFDPHAPAREAALSALRAAWDLPPALDEMGTPRRPARSAEASTIEQAFGELFLGRQRPARLAAVRAAAGLEGSRAVSLLSTALLSNDDADVRVAAARELARFATDPAAVKALRRAYLRDPSPLVRSTVQEALGGHVPFRLAGAVVRRSLEAVAAVAIVAALVYTGVMNTYRTSEGIPGPIDQSWYSGTFGGNRRVDGRLQRALTSLAAVRDVIPSLQPVQGQIWRMALPGRPLDRFFGNPRREALVFTLRGQDDIEVRILVIRVNNQTRVMALGVNSVFDPDGPAGDYIDLMDVGEQSRAVVPLLRQRVEQLLAQSEDRRPGSLGGKPATGFDVFVPLVTDAETRARVERTINANLVLRRTFLRAQAGSPDLSFGGRVFSVRPEQGDGRLSEDFRVLQRSLSRSIRGEVGWAYLLGRDMTRTILPAALPPSAPRLVADYFKVQHPDLWSAVADARDQLAEDDWAMELVAVLVGTVGAQQREIAYAVWPGAVPDDVFDVPVRVQGGRSQGGPPSFAPLPAAPAPARPPVASRPRRVVEPLSSRDIELLVQLRLLPSTMRPSALGYDDPHVGHAYYWFYSLLRRRTVA
jgi:HEAT repeat protein